MMALQFFLSISTQTETKKGFSIRTRVRMHLVGASLTSHQVLFQYLPTISTWSLYPMVKAIYKRHSDQKTPSTSSTLSFTLPLIAHVMQNFSRPTSRACH